MENTKQGKVYIVVGGQFGSESKGLVVDQLAREHDVEYAVRTGSINAGHTSYYKGAAYAMEQIPVAWGNPKTKLIIGAAAYVHADILDHEIKVIEEATGQSLKGRLFIDKRAGTHLPKHAESSVGRHERMGTVGAGCSSAIVERIRREPDCKLFRDTDYARANNLFKFDIVDTVQMLNDAYDHGEQIILEGTQGSLLDVYLGHWPFSTSRQTVAASWMAEAGLSPSLNTEVVLVCRTHPIRVAGNSGPMIRELTWPKLAEKLNLRMERNGRPLLVEKGSIKEFNDMLNVVAKEWGLPDSNFEEWHADMRRLHSDKLVGIHKEVLKRIKPETLQDLMGFFEITTVTKKLRRIAELDISELKYTIMINRPKYLVVNFLNYVYPTLNGCETLEDSPEYGEIKGYLKSFEELSGMKIGYINWKPDRIEKIEDVTKLD